MGKIYRKHAVVYCCINYIFTFVDEEFEPVFGMSRQVYNSMPKWKQDTLKKYVGLF